MSFLVSSSFGTRAEHFYKITGFPFETSIAVCRLILSGVLDRYPRVTFLLAHAGGTLPFLAGRLDSCLASDPAIAARLQHTPTQYLVRNFYYDGVIYHQAGLEALMKFLGSGGDHLTDRIVWGTDHPFFPPPASQDQETALWPSTMKNYAIIPPPSPNWDMIVRENAAKLLNIPL